MLAQSQNEASTEQLQATKLPAQSKKEASTEKLQQRKLDAVTE